MEEDLRVIVYDEPGITFCEPLPNDWHLTGFALRDRLQSRGLEVFGEHETTADPEKDVAIYYDALLRPQHPPMHKKSLFISLEPPVVNPRFYDRIDGWLYNRILTFSRKHCNDRNIYWVPFPTVRYASVKTDKINRICAISTNHRQFDGHHEELYSTRRRIYQALGKQLDLYGRLWQHDPEISHLVNYKGPCGSNYKTFCKYKVALSIENQYLEGYCSEKYWTPLQAGCELQRIGWNPDYTLSDCDEKGWSEIITGHVKAIL